MCVFYFVWYFSIFLLYFSKILATNIDSITSYSKIREEIKSMYVCMYVCVGLMVELQAVSLYAMWVVLHHGAGVTGQVLDLSSLGNKPPLAMNIINSCKLTCISIE